MAVSFPTDKETIEYFDDLLSSYRAHQVINDYCLRHDIDKSVLLGKSRKPKYVQARHDIAYLLKGDYGPTAIGRILNRDHSTIIHYFDDYTPPTS